ncbi:hypothetical protein VNO77_02824 [Canavalia gladiata]|uniref:Uncharacterized protein n=1 Tax=Canavalia gladiata TaxID=3824 RepID=A0AAN9MTU1_CANGL
MDKDTMAAIHGSYATSLDGLPSIPLGRPSIMIWLNMECPFSNIPIVAQRALARLINGILRQCLSIIDHVHPIRTCFEQEGEHHRLLLMLNVMSTARKIQLNLQAQPSCLLPKVVGSANAHAMSEGFESQPRPFLRNKHPHAVHE